MKNVIGIVLILGSLALAFYIWKKSKKTSDTAITTIPATNTGNFNPQTGLWTGSLNPPVDGVNSVIQDGFINDPVVPQAPSGYQPEVVYKDQIASGIYDPNNLAPSSVNEFGEAWNLMVISQAEWNQKLTEGWTNEQLKQYYTTSEYDRVRAMAVYWQSQHPNQPLPDYLNVANINPLVYDPSVKTSATTIISSPSAPVSSVVQPALPTISDYWAKQEQLETIAPIVQPAPVVQPVAPAPAPIVIQPDYGGNNYLNYIPAPSTPSLPPITDYWTKQAELGLL